MNPVVQTITKVDKTDPTCYLLLHSTQKIGIKVNLRRKSLLKSGRPVAKLGCGVLHRNIATQIFNILRSLHVAFERWVSIAYIVSIVKIKSKNQLYLVKSHPIQRYRGQAMLCLL